jgi:hypothetical protein
MLRCGPTIMIDAMTSSSTRNGPTIGAGHTHRSKGTGRKGIDQHGVTRAAADARRLLPDRH